MLTCLGRRAVVGRGHPMDSVEYQAMSIMLVEGGLKPDEKRISDINSRGKPKGDPVFDGWLNHHLSRLYGPVLNEPIPKELLRLLEEKLR